MGYVKSPDEVEQIQRRMEEARFETESLEVYFRTDPDFVREVLPPCFQPAEQARGFVQIGTSKATNLEVEFSVATIHVAARYEGVQGWYHVTMFLTGDMPITLGRELWGEAKKRGEITLDTTLPGVHGWAERNGAVLIEASVEATEDHGPREEAFPILNLKAFLNGSATDLEYDPIVLQTEYIVDYSTYYEGAGTITLHSTDEEPCGTVPILAVDRAVYSKHAMRPSYGAQHRIAGAHDAYVPYMLGRSYDVMARRSAL
jgi:acetoacetate decarboxylase